MSSFAQIKKKPFRENTMKLSKAQKEDIFTKFGQKKTSQDSGSPESQIALFTHRIKGLTQHLKKHKGDHASKVGLNKLIGERRSKLTYLQRKDIERYRNIIASLGLRK